MWKYLLLSLMGDSPRCTCASLSAAKISISTCDLVLCFGRHDWGSQLLTAPGSTSVPSVSLLETVACLINPKLPWNCKVVGYLQRRKIYCLFRGIIISVLVSSVSISVQWSSIYSIPLSGRYINPETSDNCTYSRANGSISFIWYNWWFQF